MFGNSGSNNQTGLTVEESTFTGFERVPSGSRWIHEIKFDGYRVQVHLHNEGEVGSAAGSGHDDLAVETFKPMPPR